MRFTVLVLLLSSIASAWTAGWRGPFKVISIEPGFSTSAGHYAVQFHHSGTIEGAGCGENMESKLFYASPNGLDEFGLQQAKVYFAGLMTAFYTNANIWLYYTGSYCNTSGVKFGSGEEMSQ